MHDAIEMASCLAMMTCCSVTNTCVVLQASRIEDIPGRPQTVEGKVMETAEGTIQRFDPFSRIHQHVCGFHFYAHDITRQVCFSPSLQAAPPEICPLACLVMLADSIGHACGLNWSCFWTQLLTRLHSQ